MDLEQPAEAFPKRHFVAAGSILHINHPFMRFRFRLICLTILYLIIVFSCAAAYGNEQISAGLDGVSEQEDLMHSDLRAQNEPNLNEKSRKENPSHDKEEGFLAKTIRGLLLISHPSKILAESELSIIEGLAAEKGLKFPFSLELLEAKLRPFYQGKTITLECLEQIRTTIYRFFENKGRPFVIVAIPEQKLAKGILQIAVIQGRIGDICVTPLQWIREETIRKYFSAKPGEEIDIDLLRQRVNFINRNPFHQVHLAFHPGKEEGTTDIEIEAQDRFPFRPYVGADNTGLVRTGRQRAFVGFFSRGIRAADLAGFRYTTAYEPRQFQSFTGQYTIPFSWRDIFTIYGGYSILHASLPFPETSNRGESSQISARYEILLGLGQPTESIIILGADYKGTNSTIFFQEIYPQFSSLVNLTQLVLGGSIQYKDDYNYCFTKFELFGSPCPILANSETSHMQTLRPGAKSRWIYGRGTLHYIHTFNNGFSVSLQGSGQGTSTPLLPSEQYGIGGHDTVRGYDERQLNLDNAIIGNFELRSCPIRLVSRIRNKRVEDALVFHLFVDYGWGTNLYTVPGESSPSYLLGAGPGLRYNLSSYVSARFDWGWKLHDKHLYTGGKSMVFFSVTIGY